MTPAIRIQARSPRGHRRCGLRHPAQPVLHPPGTFTPEDFRTLCDDPRLLVEIVGDLAMGALTGPEIAATMGGDTATGGHFTDWEVPAGWGAAGTLEADAPESGASTDGEGSSVSTPAEPSTADASEAEGGAAEVGQTGDGAAEDAPEKPARTRKAKDPS